jgi:hypothetical protein
MMKLGRVATGRSAPSELYILERLQSGRPPQVLDGGPYSSGRVATWAPLRDISVFGLVGAELAPRGASYSAGVS